MASNQELLNCPICLDLLKDPVTIACGHSYCMKCISTFWDTNNNTGRRYTCPWCRANFHRRPALKRSTLLVTLLEEHRKKINESAADGDDDVPCNACTGSKTKAYMFCLVCLASYCETHLKPHFGHNLIKASARIKESICGHHNKLLEIYCRTDQQFICLMCLMDEHKGHDTVAASVEKCHVQRQLERIQQETAEKALNSERKIEELRQAADSIKDAAWKVIDEFERLCVEHIRSVQRKCDEMREKVGEAEKAGVEWTNIRFEELQREVLELRRREDQLNQLSLTEDPVQFLQGFWALGDLPVFTDSHESLDRVMEFVTAQKDKLTNMCNEEKKALFSYSESNLLSLLPIARVYMKITSKTCLLTKYKNSQVEVDPNTVTACLCLSDGNTEISWGGSDQAHPDHPDRFTYYHQALSKNGLSESHYWEVEWDGGVVDVAVSYKGIKRKGSGKDCSFGHNNLSWKLTCSSSGCMFWHNGLHKGQIHAACSRRLGVCLDYKAGTLGFYSVSGSNTLTLLHQIHTTFTEPLYPGFSVNLGSTLKICNI